MTLAGASAAFGKPKPIVISRVNLNTRLTRGDIAQIAEHVKYWVDQIVQAKTTKDVYDARDGLLAEYNKYASSQPYQLGFARTTAQIVPGGLTRITGSSQLDSIKHVNLAIAMSRMTRTTAIPALHVLVRHGNSGVRYLGWRGLRVVRDRVILRGGQETKRLFATLTERAKVESSALVAAQMIDVLNVGKTAPPGVTEADFGRTQNRAFETLVTVLSSCCNRLAAGDASWSRPCEVALGALGTFTQVYRKNPNMVRVVTQQTVNIAWAAAEAYQSTGAKGMQAAMCDSLLQRVEPVIEALAGKKGRHIREPLADKEMSAAEKIPAVLNGVLEWIEALGDRRIKKPVFQKPKPKVTAPATTQPATRPAV